MLYTNFKVIYQHKFDTYHTCIMCNPWKRTFTLTFLVHLIMFSLENKPRCSLNDVSFLVSFSTCFCEFKKIVKKFYDIIL